MPQNAKVTLHWLNGSRAQGILWLLEELQIPYDVKVYHRGKNLRAPAELTKLHPLGKSPLVTITPPSEEGGESSGSPAASQIVLAETAFIASYLCEHFGGVDKGLVPKRWKDGQEGKVGGETESWLRWQHLMYYVEGSYMPPVFIASILNAIKGPAVPFLVRPITSVIANRVMSLAVFPDMVKHFGFLEQLLETPAPGEGEGTGYLCGPRLTAADIVLAFPLLFDKESYQGMGAWEKGTPKDTFPAVWAYMERIEAEPGFKRAADKIKGMNEDSSLTPRAGGQKL